MIGHEGQRANKAVRLRAHSGLDPKSSSFIKRRHSGLDPESSSFIKPFF
jgi:hypothetical protein